MFVTKSKKSLLRNIIGALSYKSMEKLNLIKVI